MNASLKWSIRIYDDWGHKMGNSIIVSSWDVLSKLADLKAQLPQGWKAEAYPII